MFPRVSTSSDCVVFDNRDIIWSLWDKSELRRNLILTISSWSRMRLSSIIKPSVSWDFPMRRCGFIVDAFLLRFFFEVVIFIETYMNAPSRERPHGHVLSRDIRGMTSARSWRTLSMFSLMVLTTSSLSTVLPVIQQS